jgi:hypothetical protein
MVNAGLVRLVVVDSHKAEFWAQIFPQIRLHPEAAVRTGGAIGWAFRKGNPKLPDLQRGQRLRREPDALLGRQIEPRTPSGPKLRHRIRPRRLSSGVRTEQEARMPLRAPRMVWKPWPDAIHASYGRPPVRVPR